MSKDDNLSYALLKLKEGFVIRWKVNDEFRIILNKHLQNPKLLKIESIDCHMKIWTKIFYEKHRSSTWLRKHSESYILQNLPNKLINICTDEKSFSNISKYSSDNKRMNNRYEMYEVYKHDKKDIIYKYVISVENKRIKIISIHRNK